MQSRVQASIQTQGVQLVDRQDPAEQLEGEDPPAALGNSQWATEVHHLTGRWQHTQQLLLLL